MPYVIVIAILSLIVNLVQGWNTALIIEENQSLKEEVETLKENIDIMKSRGSTDDIMLDDIMLSINHVIDILDAAGMSAFSEKLKDIVRKFYKK